MHRHGPDLQGPGAKSMCYLDPMTRSLPHRAIYRVKSSREVIARSRPPARRLPAADSGLPRTRRFPRLTQDWSHSAARFDGYMVNLIRASRRIAFGAGHAARKLPGITPVCFRSVGLTRWRWLSRAVWGGARSAGRSGGTLHGSARHRGAAGREIPPRLSWRARGR